MGLANRENEKGGGTLPLGSSTSSCGERRGGSMALLFVLLSQTGCRNEAPVPVAMDAPWGVGEARRYAESWRELEPSEAEYQVVVPLGVERSRFALLAADSLSIGPAAKVFVTLTPSEDSTTQAPTDARGPNAATVEQEESELAQPMQYAAVCAGDEVRVGRGAQIGSVYTYREGAQVRVEEAAAVHGYVKTSGRLMLTGHARVSLGSLENLSMPVEEYRWSIDFPSDSELSFRSGEGGRKRLDLVPGDYRALTIEPRTTVLIHSGTYRFASFHLKDNGFLEIDNSNGPVYIWIEDSLELSGSILDLYVAANILFGYAGREPLSLDSTVRATLVAPHSALELPATPRAHSGAFIARSIRLAPGALVQHRPFSPLAATRARNQVCAHCDEHVERRRRRCCDAFRKAMPDATLGPTLRHAESQVNESTQQARGQLDRCVREVSALHLNCTMNNGFRPGACTQPSSASCEP
jgi:hypothetical protein